MDLINPKDILLQNSIENYDLFTRVFDLQENKRIKSPLAQITGISDKIGVDQDFANTVMTPFLQVDGFNELFSVCTIGNPILVTIDGKAIAKRMFPANQGQADISYFEIQDLSETIKFQKALIPILKNLQASSALLVNFKTIDLDDNYQYYAFSFARHKLNAIKPNKIINTLQLFDEKDFEYFNIIFTNNNSMSNNEQQNIKDQFFGEDTSSLFVVGQDQDLANLTFVLNDSNNAIENEDVDFNYQDRMVKADYTTIGRYLPASTNQDNIEVYKYYMQIIWDTLINEISGKYVFFLGDAVTWSDDSSEIQIATLNLFDIASRYEYVQKSTKSPIDQMIFMTAPQETLIKTINAGAGHLKPFKNQRLDDVRISLRNFVFNRTSPVYNKLMSNLEEVDRDD